MRSLTAAALIFGACSEAPEVSGAETLEAQVAEMNLGDAIDTLQSAFKQSCYAMGNGADRVDMDAIVALRNEIAPEIAWHRGWRCPASGDNDGGTITWGATFDRGDVTRVQLDEMYLSLVPVTMPPTRREDLANAINDYSDAAKSFVEDCKDKAGTERLLAHVDKRDFALESLGLAQQDGAGWYCHKDGTIETPMKWNPKS